MDMGTNDGEAGLRMGTPVNDFDPRLPGVGRAPNLGQVDWVTTVLPAALPARGLVSSFNKAHIWNELHGVREPLVLTARSFDQSRVAGVSTA